MEIVVKIGMLGIVVAIIGVQFKGIKNEYGIYIGIVCATVICFYLLRYLQSGLEMLDFIKKSMPDDQIYFSLLLKMLGITYICEFCASICREAGYISMADQIEVFGKISILLIAMPITKTLFDMMSGFL